ncbi:restriction endonuclease subunit S [Eubacterium sp.]|uniref:restriction endonuclease subunit S n=1 Tax=Eubacterium sp. TaxID=142586 RepID=UPI00258DA24F|nr:restriction endonuclease subunit S [Eubacterium sp.]
MRVKLEEVCKRIYAGGDVPKDRFSEKKTEVYSIPIFANAEKDEGLYGYTDEAREKELSITVAARGTIGYTAIRREPFLPVVRLITVVPDLSKVSERYLFYALKNCKPQSSGTSIPQLTVPDIKKYTLNLIDIVDQESIADRLDKLNEIINLRKEEIIKFDELIKARFVEMFENDSDENTYRLEEIADIVSGITKGRKTKETEFREVPYMAVSNVKDGYIDWTTVKTILATEDEIRQYKLMSNDVLMTEGGDPDKLGRGAIISNPPEDCIHQNHIFRVRLDEKRVLPRYFSAYL